MSTATYISATTGLCESCAACFTMWVVRGLEQPLDDATRVSFIRLALGESQAICDKVHGSAS